MKVTLSSSCSITIVLVLMLTLSTEQREMTNYPPQSHTFPVQSAKFGNNFQFPIKYFSGEFGTVAGWGRLSEGGVLPSILQHVSFNNIISDIYEMGDLL